MGVICLFILIFFPQPSQMWSYGPSTASVSRPSWWGPDSSSMQSTWSFWRGGLLLHSLLFILPNPWWKRSVPHQYAIKEIDFHREWITQKWMVTHSQITRCPLLCVTLISRWWVLIVIFWKVKWHITLKCF